LADLQPAVPDLARHKELLPNRKAEQWPLRRKLNAMIIVEEPPATAIQFSHPCLVASESWIIENMVRDFEHQGRKYCVTRNTKKVKGQLRDVLILWKVL